MTPRRLLCRTSGKSSLVTLSCSHATALAAMLLLIEERSDASSLKNVKASSGSRCKVACHASTIGRDKPEHVVLSRGRPPRCRQRL